MSYINIPAANLADFNKAVISLWFRVPQASVDAAAAAFVPTVFDPTTGPSPPPQLNGIIPLVTFGKIFDDAYTLGTANDGAGTNAFTQTLIIYGAGCTVIGSTSVAIPANAAPIPVAEQTYSLDQCYIGVDCSGPGTLDGLPTLHVLFQMPDYATTSGNWTAVQSIDSNQNTLDQVGAGCSGTEGPLQITDAPPGDTTFVFAAHSTSHHIFEDFSSLIYGARREWFGDSSAIKVTPDKWHHVLLSVDLSGSVHATGAQGGTTQSLSSTCKMWAAFDDVNYTGDDMPTIGSFAQLTDPNAIVTQNAVNTFFTSLGDQPTLLVQGGIAVDITTSGADTAATYDYSPSGVPSAAQPIGLPASAEMVDHILHCEMAEFQMFTGVSMDTGVAANRRAFIGGDGKPVRYPAAAKVLGQKPDVAFVNTSQNWIIGRDQGSLKPGGFAPTGRIKVYFPNPRLGA